MSRRCKFIVLGLIATHCALGIAPATAATYKCKDADGSWSEAACQNQNKTAPSSSSSRAPAAATHPSAPTNTEAEQKYKEYNDRLNACVNSLMGDSGFDRDAANSACRLRSSKEFYLCVYHLTTFNIERINAVHACSINPSMEAVNCIYHGTQDSAVNKNAVIDGCVGK